MARYIACKGREGYIGMEKVDIFGGQYPNDPNVIILWHSCLKRAICDQSVLDDFKNETGVEFVPSTEELQCMIDKYTGAEAHFLIAFANWMNINVWGDTQKNAETKVQL